MPRRPALVYPATPPPPAPPVDLSDRSTRERLSGPALRAFFNVMARWQVKDDDARQLLGGVTNGPYYEMKRSPDRLLDVDRLTRVSLVVGIFKALGVLHSESLAFFHPGVREPVVFCAPLAKDLVLAGAGDPPGPPPVTPPEAATRAAPRARGSGRPTRGSRRSPRP